MSTFHWQKTEFNAQDGTPIRLLYDADTDMLELFFGENARARGVELTEHIILRVDLKNKRAVSLIIQHFSVITEQTEYGLRSFSLDRLLALPEEVQIGVLQLLRSLPVSQFLTVSHIDTPSTGKLPVIFVNPSYLLEAA